MGCTSSQEEVQEISYGPCEPVAGQKKQFIEAVNLPNKGAQKKVETPKFETPKYVKVSLIPCDCCIPFLDAFQLLSTLSAGL